MCLFFLWTKMRIMIHYAVEFIVCQCSITLSNICMIHLHCVHPSNAVEPWGVNYKQRNDEQLISLLRTVISLFSNFEGKQEYVCFPLWKYTSNIKDYFLQITNKENVLLPLGKSSFKMSVWDFCLICVYSCVFPCEFFHCKLSISHFSKKDRNSTVLPEIMTLLVK